MKIKLVIRIISGLILSVWGFFIFTALISAKEQISLQLIGFFSLSISMMLSGIGITFTQFRFFALLGLIPASILLLFYIWTAYHLQVGLTFTKADLQYVFSLTAPFFAALAALWSLKNTNEKN